MLFNNIFKFFIEFEQLVISVVNEDDVVVLDAVVDVLVGTISVDVEKSQRYDG